VIYALKCNDPEEGHVETVTSTKSLLPVELTIRDHYGRETQCALHKLPAVMGRDEGADVQLSDPWVSHRHCEIDQIGDVLVVRDLDSKNGIFMRGHRVRESQVLSGEQLTVARTEIIVRYPGTAQAAMETEVSKPPGQKPRQTPIPDTRELL
jgi:pSer/pThr/pTyr-binding forkhead associated (FHA) protein